MRIVTVLCFVGLLTATNSPSTVLAEQRGSVRALSTSNPNETAEAEVQIDRLARYLRIRTYEMYRANRSEYDRRRTEIQRRMDQWHQSDRSAESTRQLIDWLTQSLRGLDGYRPSMSPPPNVVTARTVRPMPPHDRLPVDAPPPPDTLPAPIQRHTAAKPEIDAAAIPAPSDATLSPLPEAAAPTDAGASSTKPTSPPTSRAVDQPLPADPYAGNRGLSIDELANRPAPFEANPRLPDSVPPPVLPPSVIDVPDAPPFVPPAFAPRTVPSPEVEVPKITGLAEMRGTGLRSADHAAAGGTGKSVEVNFTEIAARVRGYNVSLREVENKLSQDTAWTAADLAPVLDEVEELSRRRQDLVLYEKALPAIERAQLANLATIDQAVRLLGTRISAARRRLTKATDAVLSAAVQRDLTRLDDFSRRLANLATSSDEAQKP